MYAIIKSGGRQHRVEEGDLLEVDLLDLEDGSEVSFEDVLLVVDGENITVGQPTISGKIVKGQLIKEVKGPKEIAFKYKRRQNYHLKKGHRQKYSLVKITNI